MTAPLADLSSLLVSTLRLDAAPVALRYVAAAPSGVAVFDETVPAGCSLWRKAEGRTFFAGAHAHGGCVVGMHTQGLPMDGSQGEELMGLIGQMASLSYLSPDEVPSIPTVAAERTGPGGGLVEGPLADVGADETIDAVLLWVTPAQAMVLNEALGGAAWGGKGLAVLGRPACGAIPAALRSKQPVMSLGCAGMRTFTEIADEKALMVLPAASLDPLLDALNTLSTANEHMREFYADRKAGA